MKETAPNSGEDLVLAMDLGGTKTLIGLVDGNYRVIAEEQLPTSKLADGDTSSLTDAVRRIFASRDAAAMVSAIGVGIAGVPDSEGIDVRNAPNLGGIPGTQIGVTLAREFGLPVFLENDVNLALIGEQAHGVAKGLNDVAYLSLGTGVGLGIISNGELVRGFRGAAGEIEHLPAWSHSDHGTSDSSFEKLLSGPELAARAQTVFGFIIDPAEIIAKAHEGDSDARNLLDSSISALADLVSMVVGIVDPEIIVLGGGLGSNEVLVDNLQNELGRRDFPIKVRTGGLGKSAPLIGARVVCDKRLGAEGLR